MTTVVAVVAVAAATLGPLYSATAQDSLVRRQLADAPTFQTGLVSAVDLGSPDDPRPPEVVVSSVSSAVSDPRYDGLWGQQALAVSASTQQVVVPSRPTAGYQAVVSWRAGMCDSVRVARGRCPDGTGAGPAEAMVSTRMASGENVELGQRLSLGLSSTAADGDSPVVVGLYDAATARAPGWIYDSPAQAAPPKAGSEVATLDEVLVNENTVLTARVGVRVTGFRALLTPLVHARQLPEIRALSAPAPGAVQVSSSAPALFDAIAGDQTEVRTAAVAVTLQLVLLALFVLYLVIAAAAEERAPEVALAKLRGMTPGSTAAFTLAEPVLLLLVALPVGVFAAVGGDVLLARGLTAGSEVRFGWPAAVAAVAGLAGGVAAAGLAARRLLGTPVMGQLRRTGGRRAALARSVGLDTAAVVAAAAGIYELRSGSADLVALAAPGLIALALGLVAVRLIPPLARVAVRSTRRSYRIGSFLAARNTARRPAASRLVVLLAVAVALAVFGVNGELVARTVSGQIADVEVGASRVVHVRAASPGALLAAVRAADPGGEQALAAVQSTGNSGTPLLAVDAARLGAVSAWQPAWAGTTPAALAAALHPSGYAPVPVRGRLTATWADTATGAAGIFALSADIRTPDGRRVAVDAATLRPQSRGSLDVTLPAACQDTTCALFGWDFARSLTGTGSGTRGQISLTDLADARGPLTVDALPSDGSRWRYERQQLDVLNGARSPDALVTPAGANGFSAGLDPSSLFDFAVVPAAVPPVVPALFASGTDPTPFTGLSGTGVIDDLTGASMVIGPVAGRGPLPRVGADSAMVDLELLSAEHPEPGDDTDEQVWFAPGADVAGVMARLASAGIGPDASTSLYSGPTVETIAATTNQLAAGGPAVGLRLYVAAAAAAVVLALGALLTAAFVAARRRSYEIAAVLALGGSRAALRRAGTVEQLVLVILGTAIGLAVGIATARLALPNIGAVTAGGPVAPRLVMWLPVLVLVAVVLAVAGLVSSLSSRRTVRLSGPDRLREVQA